MYVRRNHLLVEHRDLSLLNKREEHADRVYNPYSANVTPINKFKIDVPTFDWSTRGNINRMGSTNIKRMEKENESDE